MPTRALRGATTVENDDADEIHDRVKELLGEVISRNGVRHEDVISIVFTSTDDLRSAFPAAAARAFGLGDVPLLCARELDVVGGTPRCIRLLMHLETDHDRKDLRHTYLHGAIGLRDDLPG